MKRAACKLGLALGLSVAVLQPSPAWACAVCFGQSDADITKGLVWGVAALLMIVASVLAGITAFFVQAARRSSSLEAATARESKPTAELIKNSDQPPS